jgi:hypothetical protein
VHPTGTFHDDEAFARDGERWLALEDSASGARLTSTRVRVTRVHDAVVDAEGEATGREVVAVAAPEAGVLLRGAGLRAGPVERVERLDDSMLPPGEFAAFHFRGAEYRLRARCAAPPAATDEGQACDVVLAGPAGEQVLFGVLRWVRSDGGIDFGDAARPLLLHAGDFDRDGRPDLILDTTDHYNVAEPTLFLSAPASHGGRLQAVATHRSTGC